MSPMAIRGNKMARGAVECAIWDLEARRQGVDANVMRAKFRESFSRPIPLRPGQVAQLDFTMPDVFHTFRRGHRMLVQVQGSWFPLVDRNPQTFVPNIFFAKPADYKKATQSIYRSAKSPSSVILPIAE